jgi:hypothetical protein
MKNLLERLSPARATFPLARRRCDLVIVSAASDGEWLGTQELLDSLATYLDCDYEVVVADDATTDGTHECLLNAGCWVVRNPQKLYLAGIDLTLRRAFLEAHRLFESPIYLKIDPDALVIGTGLLNALQTVFSADPKIGLLGTPYDMAIRNGYQLGDGVQGGAYAVSHDCLDTVIRHGWFHGKNGYHPSIIKGQHVAEDSLIAMLTYASGFRAQDIGGPGQPFGIWDVGLPMPPEELVRQNRLVTHAIKYKDAASLEARNFFRARRDAYRSGQHR